MSVQQWVYRLVTIVALAALGTMPRPQPSPATPGPSGITLRNFSGVVNTPSPEMVQQMGLGWARADFDWTDIEPAQGKWTWDKTDQLVQAAHAQSLEILPVVAYTAPWAESIPGAHVSAPKRVEDWQDFVEHVVARYRAAPYNLRYFQVWNEPTVQAGFWKGASNRDFIGLVYLPAAKIIRSHGGRVVFGGWPHSNSLAELNDLLNTQDAWRWTDVVDVHYFGGAAWQPLYDAWLLGGKCMGIWQTEIGYTSNPDYLASVYLRALNWGLRSGWKDPDQYKVFWYAGWGSGVRADRCLTKSEGQGQQAKSVLTQNGQRLAVLNDVLGAGTLAAFTDFSTNLSLPPAVGDAQPAALGFKVGDGRVVIALFMDKAAAQKYPSLSVRASLRTKPGQIELVTASGQRRPLTGDYRSGQLQVAIPLRGSPDDCPACVSIAAYLELEGL
jgi:hypothetical protein